MIGCYLLFFKFIVSNMDLCIATADWSSMIANDKSSSNTVLECATKYDAIRIIPKSTG